MSLINSRLWRTPPHFWWIPIPLGRSPTPHPFAKSLFDAVRSVVTACGVLANKDRRALDSTILHDAVATGDTVTMISAQIRRCRRLIPEAADLALVAHDLRIQDQTVLRLV